MKLTQRSPYESGREYAFRTIRDNIVLTELPPGALVSEKELADQMGLSRTPVREALIDLSKVGIVEVLPQRGSRIAYLNYDLVDEARFMRLAIETAVCKKLCQMTEPELLDPLLEYISRQADAIRLGNNDLFLALDDAFHKALFELAGMVHAHQLLSGFVIHFDRVRTLSLSPVNNTKMLSDHRELVNALLARDPLGAEQAVEKHLSRYKVDEVSIRLRHESFFRPPADF